MRTDNVYMIKETSKTRDSYALLKCIAISIFMMTCLAVIFHLHQAYTQKLITDNERLNQKKYLVSQMHDEMLTISRVQLELLHVTSEQQAKTKLQRLSTLISEHLVHYYQFKSIADESDSEVLVHFKASFEKWYKFNANLLTYAKVVADSGFINTLSKVDLAISQLDKDSEKTLQLISQIKKLDNNIN